MASDARSDAPFGARLLAVALATSALLGLAWAWAQQRALAAIADPGSDWSAREKLFDTLTTLSHGEIAGELLLAVLVLIGAARLGRGRGDGLLHKLSLGAGLCLALEALRVAGLNLELAWRAPDVDAAAQQARIQLWLRLGLLLRVGGLGLLTAAIARGDALLGRRRPWWALVVGVLLLLYPLSLWLGRGEGSARGSALIDWLPLIVSATTLTLAAAAVRHAARVDAGPVAAAWARAAAGLERYRDATALRVLVFVCVAVFVLLARFSGFSPRITLGGLALLGALGPLIALHQIVGLTRVADVPVGRDGLAVALPLLGLGLAAECAALVPIASFVLSGGDGEALRKLDLGSLGGATQALGLLTMVVLLLSFRRLARARDARGVVARCDALLIALATLLALGLGAYWTVPDLHLERDVTALMTLGLGLTLLVTAIWMLVIYLRMLKELADAMAITRPQLTADAP